MYSDPPQGELVDDHAPNLATLNSQPLAAESLGGVARKYNPNRFCLHFERESDKVIDRRKHLAKTTPIISVPEV